MDIVTAPPKKRKAAGESPTAHKTIEKRRRDRINDSLNVLRTLVPAARKTQGVKNDKVELLKMTIEYLREHQGKTYEPGLDGSSRGGHIASPTRNEEVERQMRHGMEDCIQDVGKYLMEAEGISPTDPQLVNLLAHLKCWAMSHGFSEQHVSHLPHNTVPLAHETRPTPLQAGNQAGISQLRSTLSAVGSTAPNAHVHSSVSRGHTSVPVLSSPLTTPVTTTRAAALMPPSATGQLTSPSSSQQNELGKASASGGLIKSEYSSGLDLISTVSMATGSMAVDQPADRVSSDTTAPVQAAVTQRPVSVLLQQPSCASAAFPVVQPTQTVAVVPAATHPLVAPPPLAVPNQSAPAAQPNVVQASPAARLPTAATVYIHPASVLAAGTTQISAGTATGWAPGGGVLGQVGSTATTIAGPSNIAAPQVIANQPMHMTALPIPPTGGYLSFWPSQPTAYITAPAVAATSTASSQQQWQQ